MGRKCCVPGCKSNYGVSGPHISVFRFPKDPILRQEWARSINRENFEPNNNSVVCINHFDPNCVLREDDIPMENGDTIRLPRKSPKLTNDAYPTIFPNQPSYHSVKFPQQRKNPDIREQELHQRDEECFKEWCENDEIVCFQSFRSEVQKKIINPFLISEKDDHVLFYKLQDNDVPSIPTSFKVTSALDVQVFHKNISLPTEQFKWILESEGQEGLKCNKWSKFETLVSHLGNYQDTTIDFSDRFPLKDPKRLAQWVHAVGRENWTPTKHTKICSSHFTASDYLVRPGINVPRLNEKAVPAVLRVLTRQLKKRGVKRKRQKIRHNPEITSGSKNNLSSVGVGRKRKRPSSRSAAPRKSRYNLRRAAAEEAYHEESEESEEISSEPDEAEEAFDQENEEREEILSEPGEAEGSLHLEDDEVKCEVISLSDSEPVIETPPFTYENLRDHYWSVVTLPSCLWAVHKEPSGKCIAFTHISEDTSSLFLSTDKTVLFEGTLEAELFIRGQQVTPPNIFEKALESVQDLDGLLKEMETLNLCKGTGLSAARYSSDCNLFLEKKHRNLRCCGCSVKRTHLKKTESQRLRRAAAREESMRNRIAAKRQNKVDGENLKEGSEVTSIGNSLNKQDSLFIDGEDDDDDDNDDDYYNNVDDDDDLRNEGHNTE